MTTITATPALLAFHGDAAIKRKYLRRVSTHQKLDQIVQGYGYWKDGKGCAVGCTIHGSTHKAYEKEIGVPEILAHLEDRIFEGLPVSVAKLWPKRFLAALKPGADLSLVWAKFGHWSLMDPKDGVINFTKDKDVIAAVSTVGALYQRWAAGDKPATTEWESAKNLPSASASACAYAACCAYACAYAACCAYACANASAYAACCAYAAASAYREYTEKMADKLIELLKAAPIK